MKKQIVIILISILISSTLSATISSSTTDPFKSISSTSFTQPTFNFDFGSMNNRNQAQTAMTTTRSNWDTFFTEKPKPVFS